MINRCFLCSFMLVVLVFALVAEIAAGHWSIVWAMLFTSAGTFAISIHYATNKIEKKTAERIFVVDEKEE